MDPIGSVARGWLIRLLGPAVPRSGGGRAVYGFRWCRFRGEHVSAIRLSWSRHRSSTSPKAAASP